MRVGQVWSQSKMCEELSARKLVIREYLPECLFACDERLNRTRIVEYSREYVRLELLGLHLTHGGENLPERHLTRCALECVGEQWPEERDRRDALCDALEIA